MRTYKEIARSLRRWTVYLAEAVVIYLIYLVFALLPLDAASGLGGWVARTIGPRLSLSRRARSNLTRAMPELSPEQIEVILYRMWDNLGRVMAEHPHLNRIWAGQPPARVEVIGAENLTRYATLSGQSSIVASAHLANWELLPSAAAYLGLPMTSVYRRPNNILIDYLMTTGRRAGHGRLVPKGRDGARAVVAALSKGEMVGMLVDQKMNDGISLPFFNRDAMTAPALAQLALKFRSAVVPARIERLNGAYFRLTILPALPLPHTGNRDADIRSLMVSVNLLLESWIRERPEQWLWLHNRWPN